MQVWGKLFDDYFVRGMLVMKKMESRILYLIKFL